MGLGLPRQVLAGPEPDFETDVGDGLAEERPFEPAASVGQV
jgi:hypothetical protein